MPDFNPLVARVEDLVYSRTWDGPGVIRFCLEASEEVWRHSKVRCVEKEVP